MADEAQVVVTPKSLWKSWTARVNGIVGILGMVLLAAPDFIAQLATMLSGDETKSLLQFMPEKYRHILDVVIRVLGASASFISALNIWIRKFKTIAPITGTAAAAQPLLDTKIAVAVNNAAFAQAPEAQRRP